MNDGSNEASESAKSDGSNKASESAKSRKSLLFTGFLLAVAGIGLGYAFSTTSALVAGSSGTGGQCLNLWIPNGSGNCTAGGPKCAYTAWSGTDCVVYGLRPNCQCFAGQTMSCDMTTNEMCTAGSTTCGVHYCQVTGVGLSLQGRWETTCHPAP